MSIVDKAPGVTSKQIIAAAQKKRQKLTPRDIFATLYRLEHVKGRLRAEGPRGGKKYFLAEPKEVAT
jgi:hypothetical protein